MTLPRWPEDIRWTAIGTAVLIAVLAVAAGVAMAATGETPRAGEAVAFAASICLLGGVGGWVVARWPTRDPALGVAKGMGAVTLRMFLPLAALGWLQFGQSGLREAGADNFLLVFYLLLLATDILLHMMGDEEIRGIRRKNSRD